MTFILGCSLTMLVLQMVCKFIQQGNRVRSKWFTRMIRQICFMLSTLFLFMILHKFRFYLWVQTPTPINCMFNIMAMLTFEIHSFAFVDFSFREWTCKICTNIRITWSNGTRHDFWRTSSHWIVAHIFWKDGSSEFIRMWLIRSSKSGLRLANSWKMRSSSVCFRRTMASTTCGR
jgi:vacuolar-type H+-ATPase subunit I/STV1